MQRKTSKKLALIAAAASLLAAGLVAICLEIKGRLPWRRRR